MNAVAILMCGALVAIAALHLAWAAGSTFPFRSESELAKAVVGARGIDRMPSRAGTAIVAVCLFGAAVWALWLRELVDPAPPRLVLLTGGTALAGVFALRGVAGVLPYFERRAPEQPFLRLNRLVYSPLFLAFGAGFALLVLAWPNWTYRLGL